MWMLWWGGGINSHAEQANKRMCGWQSAPQQAMKALRYKYLEFQLLSRRSQCRLCTEKRPVWTQKPFYSVRSRATANACAVDPPQTKNRGGARPVAALHSYASCARCDLWERSSACAMVNQYYDSSHSCLFCYYAKGSHFYPLLVLRVDDGCSWYQPWTH